MAINISTSPAIFWWQPAAWLRVTGPDAGTFLQGQFTNELRHVTVGGPAVYGLWLSVKGKVLADSFVLRGGNEEFWLGSYASSAAVIQARLDSFIIADDVVVENVTSAWSAVTVFEREPPRLPFGHVFRGRRGQAEAWEWVFPSEVRDEVRMALAEARELDAKEVERRRIEAGIPSIPADIGPNDLPNEGGLETEAISFTKGCYLGQEVMARLKSMGQVRRRLMRVRSADAEIPVLPAPLFLGTRQVGELRSAARMENGFIGLAMVSLLHVTAGASLAFGLGGEPRVVVADFP